MIQRIQFLPGQTLTSRRAERASGPEKVRRSIKKDFFDSIGQKRKFGLAAGCLLDVVRLSRHVRKVPIVSEKVFLG
jgi:hypothetical protein